MKANAHFWYSAKALEMQRKQYQFGIGDGPRLAVPAIAEIDGSRVEFTEKKSGPAQPVPEPCSEWDDLKYLGYGYAYSYGGVVQGQAEREKVTP